MSNEVDWLPTHSAIRGRHQPEVSRAYSLRQRKTPAVSRVAKRSLTANMVIKLLQNVLALPSNHTVRPPTNSKYGRADRRTNTRTLLACFMTALPVYEGDSTLVSIVHAGTSHPATLGSIRHSTDMRKHNVVSMAFALFLCAKIPPAFAGMLGCSGGDDNPPPASSSNPRRSRGSDARTNNKKLVVLF